MNHSLWSSARNPWISEKRDEDQYECQTLLHTACQSAETRIQNDNKGMSITIRSCGNQFCQTTLIDVSIYHSHVKVVVHWPVRYVQGEHVIMRNDINVSSDQRLWIVNIVRANHWHSSQKNNNIHRQNPICHWHIDLSHKTQSDFSSANFFFFEIPTEFGNYARKKRKYRSLFLHCRCR